MVLEPAVISPDYHYSQNENRTPVRIDKRSVHFEDMEEQPTTAISTQFSYMGEHRVLNNCLAGLATPTRRHRNFKSGLP